MKVTVRNLQKTVRISARTVKRAVQIAAKPRIPENAEVAVCIAGDAFLRLLNLSYAGVDAPTDCLAFSATGPAQEGVALMDIVVSAETAARNAPRYKTDAVTETYRYIIHGLLHLAGYSDATATGRRTMRSRERSVLKRIGRLD